MKILLSEGSGLTARQVVNRLHDSGHRVEVLSSDTLALCRFTGKVARLHRVPRYSTDPFAWLEVALGVYAEGRFDLLLPTQEQVAVLSAVPDRLAAAGVRTVVPDFEALAAVIGKLSAARTLERLGVAQPRFVVVPDGEPFFPAFAKREIGSASTGVCRVGDRGALDRFAAGEPVLVQEPVAGPLLMCQSVFDHGRLVAFHAVERTAEGANGGACRKRSVEQPAARDLLERLGSGLCWHGALSADVVATAGGPVVIDVNPRLVEPENAWRAGVDLVGDLLTLAAGGEPPAEPEGRAGVATHQLLLALLGVAQHDGRRRAIARELGTGLVHTGPYRSSREELTPVQGDLRAVIPAALVATATLVRPASWRWFASGSTEAYALSSAGWRQVVAAASRTGGDRPG